MNKVGIYLIRFDERIVVFPDGLRLLIGDVKEGETHEQAAARVLATSAPCLVKVNPVFIIAESMKGEKLYIFAARAIDTFGFVTEEAESMIETMAVHHVQRQELQEKSA